MATRIEKIFRTNTILTMNTILNEVSECVETLNGKPRLSKKEVADSLLRIAKAVDKFFLKESVTDEELQRVAKKGKLK